MVCGFCRGVRIEPGSVTVLLEREDTTVGIRDVPADVCRNCGEYWLEEGTAQRVLEQGEVAASGKSEVEIVSYVA